VNVPFHMLIHTATVKNQTGTTRQGNGAVVPTYTDTTGVRCRIQDDASGRSIQEQRIAGTLTSTGFFPLTHNGSALTLDKNTLILATIGGASRTYRVQPGRNAAGASVLQVVGLEIDQ
jgi:hypothetical protein